MSAPVIAAILWVVIGGGFAAWLWRKLHPPVPHVLEFRSRSKGETVSRRVIHQGISTSNHHWTPLVTLPNKGQAKMLAMMANEAEWWKREAEFRAREKRNTDADYIRWRKHI